MFNDGCGSFKADVHKTTSMIRYENALYDLIMHEHVCGENA